MEKGLRLLAAGRADSARRHFEKVLERVPSHLEARSRLAGLYLTERNYAKASEEAAKILEMERDHTGALCILAECSIGLGELAQARDIIDRVMRTLPRKSGGDGVSHEHLAWVVRALAKLEDDRRLDFLGRRYVRGSTLPWDAPTLARLGVAAWNVGRPVEARWFWRRAAQDPFLETVAPVLLHALDLVEAQVVPPFRMDYSFGTGEAGETGAEPAGCVKAFALHTLWHGEDAAAREAALDLLAQSEAGWAEPFLFSFLCRPEIHDSLKLRASGWLLERGFLKPDTPVVMHLEGELREVTITSVPKQPLPVGLGLVDDGRGRKPQAVAADRQAGVKGAWMGRRGGRRPAVHPGMSWEACLQTLSKTHLTSLARLLRMRGASRMVKAELAAALARWFEGNVDALLGLMAPEERGLLSWVADQGGVVTLRRLYEYAGRSWTGRSWEQEGDGPIPPEQRLLALGLLFIGSMEGKGRGSQVAVIPRELRDELLEGQPPAP